jgi:anaerobic magnesium-protoporphyrin IX monomethyl ester cyclase
MNLLLVNPRYNGRAEIPPLGLECLAAPLIEAGLGVHILDLDCLSGDNGQAELAVAIRKVKPRIVGVTAMSHSFPSARKVCAAAKAFDPAVVTVMGGVHATVRSEEILAAHPEVDVCVRGEGEKTFSDLIRAMDAGRSFSAIAGVTYRENGAVVRNEDRPLIGDLDVLPGAAYGLVDPVRYRTRSISGSRGCYHRCTFCSIQSQYGRSVRARSAEDIARDIETLAELGARRIMFTDDNFTSSLKRVKEICGGIERLGLAGKVDFYAEGRIDDICRNPVMASVMSDVGFRSLYIGAESGSAEILDYYRKDATPEEIVNGVSYCIEQNLTPVVNFILFGPRDSISTMKETIALARRVFEMGAEIVYAEALIPYPGTPIQEELKRDGMFREEDGIYFFRSYRGIEMDWVLRLCNVARAMAELLHGGDKYFAEQRAYRELGCLDGLLSGTVPASFAAMVRERAALDATLAARIEAVQDYLAAAGENAKP